MNGLVKSSNKRFRNIRILGAILAMIAIFAVVPVAQGHGSKWSGMDPVLLINGDKFSVRVEWPSEFDCSVSGPININVMLPRGADAELLTESTSFFGGCFVETSTQIIDIPEEITKSNGVAQIYFSAYVKSSESFEVKLKIDRSGELVEVSEGFSNETILSGAVTFNGNDYGTDSVLPEDYDGTGYTYETDHTD